MSNFSFSLSDQQNSFFLSLSSPCDIILGDFGLGLKSTLVRTPLSGKLTPLMFYTVYM